MEKVTYTKDKELDPSSKTNGKFPVGNESKIGPIVLLIFAHNSSEPSVLPSMTLKKKKKSIPPNKLFKINLGNISLYKIHLQLWLIFKKKIRNKFHSESIPHLLTSHNTFLRYFFHHEKRPHLFLVQGFHDFCDTCSSSNSLLTHMLFELNAPIVHPCT